MENSAQWAGREKKEYLQHHAMSNNYIKYASESYIKTQSGLFTEVSLARTVGSTEKL